MRKKILIKSLLSVVVVVAIGLPIYQTLKESDNSMVGKGSLPTLTEEERLEKINRIVEEGTFNVAMASEIYLDDESYRGKADIQNIANNHYDLGVEIILDSNKEKIFESEIMAPDTYIEEIVLDKPLDPGEHGAIAVFTAYDIKDGSVVGTTSMSVILKVIKEI